MSTEWFYTHRGNRVGPVSDAQIKLLLSGGQLDDDVQVWCKGLKDWIPIRDELSGPINDTPPPLSGRLVGNTCVWIIAFLPIIFALIDATIVQMELQDLAANGWWNLLDFNNQGGLLIVAAKAPRGCPGAYHRPFTRCSVFSMNDD